MPGNSGVVLTHECLNWQPSHFINIVGKDDRATPACAGGGEEPIAARHSCRQVAPAWHLYFPLNSLILFFPPARPRIVAASGRVELREDCYRSATAAYSVLPFLFPAPMHLDCFGLHSLNSLGLSLIPLSYHHNFNPSPPPVIVRD